MNPFFSNHSNLPSLSPHTLIRTPFSTPYPYFTLIHLFSYSFPHPNCYPLTFSPISPHIYLPIFSSPSHSFFLHTSYILLTYFYIAYHLFTFHPIYILIHHSLPFTINSYGFISSTFILHFSNHYQFFKLNRLLLSSYSISIFLPYPFLNHHFSNHYQFRNLFSLSSKSHLYVLTLSYLYLTSYITVCSMPMPEFRVFLYPLVISMLRLVAILFFP